jgi:hypothetical protein
MRVKKDGKLIYVMHDPIAKKKIAKYMEREIPQMVYTIETTKGEIVDLTVSASLPKEIELGKVYPGDLSIPKTKVEFDAERHLRVKGIASPLPMTQAKESSSMVSG